MSSSVRMPVIVPRASAAVDLALVSLGVCLLALAAQLTVPLPFTPVPLTGQTLVVLLVGGCLGPVRGVISVTSYIALGCLGAPVFAGGAAGSSVLTSSTGGYLVGMGLAAVAVGAMANNGWDRRLLSSVLGMAVGSALIYLVGATWLALSLGLSAHQAWSLGVQPFLVGDALKALVAGVTLPAAWHLVTRVDQAGGAGV